MAPALAAGLLARFKLASKISIGAASAHVLRSSIARFHRSHCPLFYNTRGQTDRFLILIPRNWLRNRRPARGMQQTLTQGIGALAEIQDTVQCMQWATVGPHAPSKNGARGFGQPAALTRGARAGNMVLFDKDGLIKRYASAEHILEEFFHLRLDFYARRRVSLIQVPPRAARAAAPSGRAAPGGPAQASVHESAAFTKPGKQHASGCACDSGGATPSWAMDVQAATSEQTLEPGCRWAVTARTAGTSADARAPHAGCRSGDVQDRQQDALHPGGGRWRAARQRPPEGRRGGRPGGRRL